MKKERLEGGLFCAENPWSPFSSGFRDESKKKKKNFTPTITVWNSLNDCGPDSDQEPGLTTEATENSAAKVQLKRGRTQSHSTAAHQA